MAMILNVGIGGICGGAVGNINHQLKATLLRIGCRGGGVAGWQQNGNRSRSGWVLFKSDLF